MDHLLPAIHAGAKSADGTFGDDEQAFRRLAGRKKDLPAIEPPFNSMTREKFEHFFIEASEKLGLIQNLNCGASHFFVGSTDRLVTLARDLVDELS